VVSRTKERIDSFVRKRRFLCSGNISVFYNFLKECSLVKPLHSL